MKKIFLTILISLVLSVTAQAKDKENIIYLQYSQKAKEIDCFSYNIPTKSKKLLFSFPSKIALAISSSINQNGNFTLHLLKADGSSTIFYWDRNKIFTFDPIIPKPFEYKSKEGMISRYDSTGINGMEITEDNRIIISNYAPVGQENDKDKDDKILWKHTVLLLDIPKNQVSTILEAQDAMDAGMIKAGFGTGWPMPVILKYNFITKSIYLYYVRHGQLYIDYENIDKINLETKQMERLAYINGEALAVSPTEKYLLYTNKDTFAGNSVNDDNNQLFLKNLKTNETNVLYDEYKENHNEGDPSQGFQIKRAAFINDTESIAYTVCGIVNYDYSKSFTSDNMKVETIISNIKNDKRKIIHDFLLDDYISDNIIIGEREKWDNDDMFSPSYIAHDSELILYNISDNSQNTIEKNVLNFIGAY